MSAETRTDADANADHDDAFADADADVEPVNILLVDDHPANLRALEAILTEPAYNLILARSGPEALALVLRHELAVVLLDVAMPEMDGFETATIIKEREQSKRIPIIFITASVYDMEHVFRGYTVGAVDYLRKPIDAYQVRGKVAVFVELFRQRRQIERQAHRLHEAERLLRERAEEALRESQALYRHTSEQARIGRREADIERASLIQRLERSVRVRDEFLAITAHELKTPLTPLRLQTKSLLREGQRLSGGLGGTFFGGAPFERFLRRLRKIDMAAARIESLIDRLLDVPLLRSVGGELALHTEDIDLRDVVENILSQITEEARHGSEITIHDDPSERVVGHWDRMRLEQVITHLVSNAIKYGKAEPIDITISTYGEGDRVWLSVRDRGIGIPASEQERIFERFERLLTPIRHFGGFGIGLWIVRAIVEAHGGHVTVSSRPDEGSEFTVELPIRPPLRTHAITATTTGVATNTGGIANDDDDHERHNHSNEGSGPSSPADSGHRG